MHKAQRLRYVLGMAMAADKGLVHALGRPCISTHISTKVGFLRMGA